MVRCEWQSLCSSVDTPQTSLPVRRNDQRAFALGDPLQGAILDFLTREGISRAALD